MHAVVATMLDAIAAACRRFGVERLDVFGSVVGDGFDPERSDVDLLVVFAPTDPPRYADQHFGLHEEVERIVGRHVDLVELGAIRNRFFRKSAEAAASVSSQRDPDMYLLDMGPRRADSSASSPQDGRLPIR